MNVFTRFFRWLGGNANTQRHGTQLLHPATTAHDDVPQIGIDSALQVSTVWACVTLLVETISSLPLQIYRTDGQGNREPVTKRALASSFKRGPESPPNGSRVLGTNEPELFFVGGMLTRVSSAGRMVA